MEVKIIALDNATTEAEFIKKSYFCDSPLLNNFIPPISVHYNKSGTQVY